MGGVLSASTLAQGAINTPANSQAPQPVSGEKFVVALENKLIAR
jgi:hypothetical protein